MKTQEAYIVDAIRTPIGKYAGSLSSVRADDLASIPIKELLKRNNTFPTEAIDDVILGCANQAGEDNRNIARMAGLLAGLPESVPGITLNRLCASGMSAVVYAANAIKSGAGNLYLAGGVEQMSRAPFVFAKSESAFSRQLEIFDTTMGWRFVNPKFKASFGVDSMGETAENVAEKYSISRLDQDTFALRSQTLANQAIKNGRLAAEIVSVQVPQKKGATLEFLTDEFPRPDSTLTALQALNPAFKTSGTVTAGNSSGINDGACSLLIASEEAVKKYSLTPKAKILADAVCGVTPRLMGIGPVLAVRKLLDKINIPLSKFDLIELNEAFAAQSLACLRELGIADNDPRINPNGGAIALGHPLGMSGARLITTAMYELSQQKKDLALCTMCIGVGQGIAVALSRV